MTPRDPLDDDTHHEYDFEDQPDEFSFDDYEEYVYNDEEDEDS